MIGIKSTGKMFDSQTKHVAENQNCKTNQDLRQSKMKVGQAKTKPACQIVIILKNAKFEQYKEVKWICLYILDIVSKCMYTKQCLVYNIVNYV